MNHHLNKKTKLSTWFWSKLKSCIGILCSKKQNSHSCSSIHIYSKSLEIDSYVHYINKCWWTHNTKYYMHYTICTKRHNKNTHREKLPSIEPEVYSCCNMKRHLQWWRSLEVEKSLFQLTAPHVYESLSKGLRVHNSQHCKSSRTKCFSDWPDKSSPTKAQLRNKLMIRT